MEEKLIIGNWKMYKNAFEAREYVRELTPLIEHDIAKVWLAVPYTLLWAVSEVAKETGIIVGAQNVSDRLEGAYTGEVSPLMLKEAGATFVLVGHSERRTLFKEDNAFLNRKIKLALSLNLEVVYCFGETSDERYDERTKEVIEAQLKAGLEGIDPEKLAKVTLAYEPVWAIGTNQAATVELIEEIHDLCKTIVATLRRCSPKEVKILYGGSVKETNAKTFLESPFVDGLLVGGASLDPLKFAEIIHQAARK